MNISILGCGWLGFPLAKKAIVAGHTISGSTTSLAKMELLQKNNINPFQISVNEDGIVGDISGLLKDSELLIVNIPPKLRAGNAENFVQKIKHLIPHLEEASLKNVLLVSSTSVFGENNTMVTESSTPNPDTESGRQLLEVENLLQQNKAFTTTILRFGGLIGEDRQPGRSLAGKTNLANPDTPVNLIHLEDCIGILLTIIAKQNFGEIWHGVAPFHPTRKEYYTQKTIQLQLPIPEFQTNSNSSLKLIESDKIATLLGYSYQLPLYS